MQHNFQKLLESLYFVGIAICDLAHLIVLHVRHFAETWYGKICTHKKIAIKGQVRISRPIQQPVSCSERLSVLSLVGIEHSKKIMTER